MGCCSVSGIAGLVKGKTIAIDATTLEANAALRSIVRRDTGESYNDFLTKLAKASGIETPTRADLAKLDRKRKNKGSNQDWEHPYDPDARIAKMKDGRTHLAHKAEHAVDLETGAIVAVTLQEADQGDTTTIQTTLPEAIEQLEAVAAVTDDKVKTGEEVVTDKGYHSKQTVLDMQCLGLRTYISEPDRGRQHWIDQHAERDAVYANRRRIRGERGQQLMRRRAPANWRSKTPACSTIPLKSGQLGIACGAGTPKAICDFGKMIDEKSTKGINATTYIKMMGHTAPVNLGVFLGITGRIITTSSACTSGSQGVGYAYETIRAGHQVAMIAGGAEELCVTEAAVFDTLFATSVRNDAAETTPRPFDAERDGLVLGEGAGTLILEELQHARARGATVHAEIVGFGTNSDGAHVTHPSATTMQIAMELALADAQRPPSAIGYLNAHGTGTQHGDVAESQATRSIFRDGVPISSLKSYMGHTLGACGALEAWMISK